MTCDSICGINSYYKSGRCICNTGYYVINGTCQSCQKGTLFD